MGMPILVPSEDVVFHVKQDGLLIAIFREIGNATLFCKNFPGCEIEIEEENPCHRGFFSAY